MRRHLEVLGLRGVFLFAVLCCIHLVVYSAQKQRKLSSAAVNWCHRPVVIQL